MYKVGNASETYSNGSCVEAWCIYLFIYLLTDLYMVGVAAFTAIILYSYIPQRI